MVRPLNGRSVCGPTKFENLRRSVHWSGPVRPRGQSGFFYYFLKGIFISGLF